MLHGGDDDAGQVGPVLYTGQVPTVKQDRFFHEFAGAFAVVRLIVFRYFLLCRWVDPQRDTDLLFFQNVHLQTLGFAGALRVAGVPIIGKCLIQVYLKRKNRKAVKSPNAVRIAGCCGSAGGVYSHPPLSCNQIAGECQPIGRRLSFLVCRSLAMRCGFLCRDGRAVLREAAFCGRCPMISARLHTRPHGAYGRGFGLRGTFPSNRVKQLSV